MKLKNNRFVPISDFNEFFIG